VTNLTTLSFSVHIKLMYHRRDLVPVSLHPVNVNVNGVNGRGLVLICDH